MIANQLEQSIEAALDEKTLRRFADLYRSYDRAHGRFKHGEMNDGKQEGDAWVKHEPAASDAFKNHLMGTAGLGLIPLLDNGNIWWAAIDIDEYSIDLFALDRKIQGLKLPLISCRSKSGGAHLYIFFGSPVSAKVVRDLLENWAAKLGYKGSEIFPKQILRQPDDCGNWINLPYFNASDTDRFAVRDGKKLSFEEFIGLAEALRVPSSDIPSALFEQEDHDVLRPPAEGRNAALFKRGMDLLSQNKTPDEIRSELERINSLADTNVHPNFSLGPLDSKELYSLLKSLERYRGHVRKNLYLSPDEALIFMNEKHAICLDNGKTVVFIEQDDPEFDHPVLKRSDFKDIREFYKTPVHIGFKNGEAQFKPLGQWWLENPQARRFNSVHFSPDREQEGAFNLWRGFAVEAVAGDWSLFKEHLLNNICNGRQDYYNYLIKWSARMIQKPGERAQVAIVMRGGRGTGKGIVGNIFIYICGKGRHGLSITQARHLTGHFNAHLRTCVFLFCDEAFWAGDKQGESTLKGLVTEDTIQIEPKGKNTFPAPNRLHIMMASNNAWVVPAGADERRFFVLDVSDKRRQDTAYFSDLMKQMESGGYEAFLYDLLRLDISDFQFRTAPVTQALLEQKLLSLPPVAKWFFEVLKNGTIATDESRNWKCVIEASAVQESYWEAMKGAGERYAGFETELGMHLRKLVPSLGKKNFASPLPDSRGRDKKRVAHYIFPSLEECRRNFESYIGTSIAWPKDEDQKNYEQDEIPF